MAYYTDSPAFQAMWQRAMGGGAGAGSSYRPLGLSGITNPRGKKHTTFLPPKPQQSQPNRGLQPNQQNPYAFNVVESKTSNAPGGGDSFGTMGTGAGQARSSQAALSDAQGQAQALTAKMSAGMTPAQAKAGAVAAPAPVAPAPAPKPAPAVKVAARPAAKKVAPRNLLQAREPGVGFGGIRPLMRFGR